MCWWIHSALASLIGSGLVRKSQPRRIRKLVHVSITAFGSTGGYQSRPAHDLNSVGYAGYLTLVKDSEGNATMPRLQNADLSAGMHTALAVLAGLRVVQRDGSGFRADISMAETAASLLPMQLSTVAVLAVTAVAGFSYRTAGLLRPL